MSKSRTPVALGYGVPVAPPEASDLAASSMTENAGGAFAVNTAINRHWIINWICCGLFFANAVALLFINIFKAAVAQTAFPVWINFYTNVGDQTYVYANAQSANNNTASSFMFQWTLFSLSFLMFVYHLWYGLDSNTRAEALKRRVNGFRWLSFAINGSLLGMCVWGAIGLSTVQSYITVAVFFIAISAFNYLAEYLNPGDTKQNGIVFWAPLCFSFIIGAFFFIVGAVQLSYNNLPAISYIVWAFLLGGAFVIAVLQCVAFYYIVVSHMGNSQSQKIIYTNVEIAYHAVFVCTVVVISWVLVGILANGSNITFPFTDILA